MNKTGNWIIAGAALLVAAATAANAAVPTLTATLTVVTMPSTITLCRDPAAIQAFGSDAQWQVFVDVDDNTGTGDAFGSDALLLVGTTPQDGSCSPHSANTQDSLLAGVFVWDENQATFVNSGAGASVVIDAVAGTMAITADIAGPLQGLSGSASLRVSALSTYIAAGTGPTFAADGALGSFAAPSSDPAQDVQQCTSPCTQTASWIKMIDLTAFSAATSEPLPAFGANTLTVEFDLAALPANLSLCRYPSTFSSSSGFDYAWLAGFDVDANPNTGLGGIDAQIVVASTGQNTGCMTHSAPIGTSLSAALGVWDEQQQAYVYGADLPLTVDVAAGKLFVQADRTAQGLAGLSSASLMGEQTVGFYTTGDQPFAYDSTQVLKLGVAFNDPLHDVLNCTSPCSTAVDWYPQIDLVGGSIHLADEIFAGNFE